MHKYNWREFETDYSFGNEDLREIGVAYTDDMTYDDVPSKKAGKDVTAEWVEVQSYLNLENEFPVFTLNVIGNDGNFYTMETITYSSLESLYEDIKWWDFASLIYPKDWRDFESKLGELVDEGLINYR